VITPQARDWSIDKPIREKYLIFGSPDCAHAVETLYHGRHVGTIGDLGAFSFYVTKNVVTGEGGMVTTADQVWASGPWEKRARRPASLRGGARERQTGCCGGKFAACRSFPASCKLAGTTRSVAQGTCRKGIRVNVR